MASPARSTRAKMRSAILEFLSQRTEATARSIADHLTKSARVTRHGVSSRQVANVIQSTLLDQIEKRIDTASGSLVYRLI